LLRGVSLGLFDDATAMAKFQAWHDEHEAQLKRRSDAHKKQQRKRQEHKPVVKKVEEQPAEGGSEAY
jgi:small subunit ribosomal protein S16